MFNFIPAKILSYDAATRTAQVQIEGLTDGAEDGLTATFANPVMYADVVSQLDGGTVYFYDVAESFMTQLPYFT